MLKNLDRITAKRVFLYLRRSSDEGSEKQIRSLSDQETDCHKLADRLGLEIVETFRESKSAWKPHQRPLFKKMLKELSYKNPKRRKADAILAWHPNRLSRNALEAGMLIQMVDDEQIKDLYFPAYSFHNDTSGKEHLTIEFARAKGYTDQLSDAVSRGVKNRELAGAMVYPVKLGYAKKREFPEPQRCSLFPIPDPETFPIVQRMFNLALEGQSTRQISDFLQDEFPSGKQKRVGLSPTAVDARLRDSFYCGQWLIKAGTKKERIINLNNVQLPDGTEFQPILSHQEFAHLQKLRSRKHIRTNYYRKRVHPFPHKVHCGHCGNKLYASFRKVKRAGGVKEEQLGYECQHREKTRCPQPRVKSTILEHSVFKELEKAAFVTNQSDYQTFLLGLKSWLKDRLDTQQSTKTRLTKSLQKITRDKQNLIFQRADLAAKDLLDPHSQEEFDKRINQLSEQHERLQAEKNENHLTHKSGIKTLLHFLELIQNLHYYWLNANYDQKAKITEICHLNLTAKGKETLSINWLPPFEIAINSAFVLDGRPQASRLEPLLNILGKSVRDYSSKEINHQIEMLKNQFPKLPYPLVRDMREITGT